MNATSFITCPADIDSLDPERIVCEDCAYLPWQRELAVGDDCPMCGRVGSLIEVRCFTGPHPSEAVANFLIRAHED